jgi:hypothetical protein
MKQKRHSSHSSPTMAHPLYLTEDVKEGWKIEMETQKFEDSQERMKIRFQFLNIENEGMKSLLSGLQNAGTPEEAKKILESADISSLSEPDTREFLFAIGPVGIGQMLAALLLDASSDADLENAADLSFARHELLASLQNFSA